MKLIERYNDSKDYSEIKKNIGKEVTTLGGYIEKIPCEERLYRRRHAHGAE